VLLLAVLRLASSCASSSSHCIVQFSVDGKHVPAQHCTRVIAVIYQACCALCVQDVYVHKVLQQAVMEQQHQLGACTHIRPSVSVSHKALVHVPWVERV
jgi:hypothetical protein